MQSENLIIVDNVIKKFGKDQKENWLTQLIKRFELNGAKSTKICKENREISPEWIIQWKKH